MIENLFFVSWVIGTLLGLSLVLQIFTPRKANFFLGLVVLMLAFELLFSWGYQSGYNQTPNAFPLWMLLNYLIIPPALWLFLKYSTFPDFRFNAWHYFLFVPALLAYLIQILAYQTEFQLKSYPLWVGFSEYIPLAGMFYVLTYFWIVYSKLRSAVPSKAPNKPILNQIRLLTFMLSLTLFSVFWLVFTFIGWKHFAIIEYAIIALFFSLAFINFLDSQHFPSLAEKSKAFPQYNDKQCLKALADAVQEKKLYLKSTLTLKVLASELKLPSRYVSYLINHYHQVNYKEYINRFRVEAFLEKTLAGEHHNKTLLALALDSGFSSKSTFNQVFKDLKGKTPTEYLAQQAVS